MITTFVSAVAVLGTERGIQLFKLITEPVQAGGHGGRTAGVVVASAGLTLSPETGLAGDRVTSCPALILQVKAKHRVSVQRAVFQSEISPPGAPSITLRLLAGVLQDDRDWVVPALQTQLGDVGQFAPLRQVEDLVADGQALLLQGCQGEVSSLTVHRTERAGVCLEQRAEVSPSSPHYQPSLSSLLARHCRHCRHCSHNNINAQF